MKKITVSVAILVFVSTSCQKSSVDDMQPGTAATGSSTPSGTVISGNTDEPFSAKFTYSVPDPNNIFEDQPIHFESRATGVVQYVWKFDNNIKSPEKSPSISFPMHGYHTIALTVTDKDGHTATSTQQVSILCNFGGSH